MSSQNRFILLALIAESFIIYASVLVKITDVSPIMVGFYRVALAIPIFYLLAMRKHKVFKIPPKDLMLMLGAGVLFGLDLVFFNLALHKTSVANVNLFASLVCFILVPIGVFFFKEKIHLGFVIGGFIALFGVILLVSNGAKISVSTPIGDLFALISMVCYSFFLALIYGLRKKYATMHLFFFTSIASSLILLLLGSAIEGFSMPSDWKNWGIILLIALFGQILGQGFFGYIMGKIPAQISSLLLLFSPIIAALMGYFILDERLGFIEIIGICIIILGVYFAQRKK